MTGWWIRFAGTSQLSILTQAWSPIAEIAAGHGKTPAQVMLRWGIQQGRSVIPKSTNPERIAENIDVFDFALSDDELARIDALDTGRRGGPDPDQPRDAFFDVVIDEA